MKRFLALTIAIIMAISFASCDSNGNKTESGKPKPNEGPKYVGHYDAFEAEIVIYDGKASLSQSMKEEASSELEEMGLTGTLWTVANTRIEFSSYTVSDGMLVLTYGKGSSAYQSCSFEGTAAEAYVNAMKAEFKKMHDAGQINDEMYQHYMSLVNGEEVKANEEEDVSSAVMNVKLNEADKTFLVMSTVSENEHDGEKEKYVSEFEYAEDGKLVKEISYTLYDSEGTARETVYYADGVTEKIVTTYNVIVDSSTGEYELGTKIDSFEYGEDGSEKKYTSYSDDGSYTVNEFNEDGSNTVTEYDENGEEISKTVYDKDGNVIEYN